MKFVVFELRNMIKNDQKGQNLNQNWEKLLIWNEGESKISTLVSFIRDLEIVETLSILYPPFQIKERKTEDYIRPIQSP